MSYDHARFAVGTSPVLIYVTVSQILASAVAIPSSHFDVVDFSIASYGSAR